MPQAQKPNPHAPATHVIAGALYNNCGSEKIKATCCLYKIAYLPDGQILLRFAQNAETRSR